jgi:hypothetical protein
MAVLARNWGKEVGAAVMQGEEQAQQQCHATESAGRPVDLSTIPTPLLTLGAVLQQVTGSRVADEMQVSGK